MKKRVSLAALATVMVLTVQGQLSLAPDVLASAGGYAEGENMTISWTLGELAVSTLTGGNTILTQGFQQPFDIGVGIHRDPVNWGISVFPNPVGNELRIRFDLEQQPGDYILEIQDVAGRILSRMEYRAIRSGDVVRINTSGYSEGVYFLKVFTPDRQQVQVTSLRKL